MTHFLRLGSSFELHVTRASDMKSMKLIRSSCSHKAISMSHLSLYDIFWYNNSYYKVTDFTSNSIICIRNYTGTEVYFDKSFAPYLTVLKVLPF